jgi:hypothetical protein
MTDFLSGVLCRYPFCRFECNKLNFEFGGEKMRKLYLAVSLLVLASMVLAACQPPPTPEPSAPANPFIGSGKLDGNGIPPDFFADVHIRKAFSYAFDWETFINDVYRGEAVQAVSLPLPGMPGYDPQAPHYTLDLAKAEEEFKLADLDKDGIPAGDDPEGDVWTTGFRLQMLYNQGNTTRQIVAEIMAANLAEINEKFVVEILGLPWPAYLAAQRAKQIPIMRLLVGRKIFMTRTTGINLIPLEHMADVKICLMNLRRNSRNCWIKAWLKSILLSVTKFTSNSINFTMKRRPVFPLLSLLRMALNKSGCRGVF